MYVYMFISDKVIGDHDCFMLMFICIHVCMSLSNRVTEDPSCGEMIAYEGEWHEGVHGL